MEASGQARWFERLLAELQIELWIGDAAEIQSKRAGKQRAAKSVRTITFISFLCFIRRFA
jgi:hypothetical protein